MLSPERLRDRSAGSMLGESPRRRTATKRDADRDFQQFAKIERERDRRKCRWRRVFDLMMPDRLAFADHREPGETPTKAVDSYPAQALSRGVGNVISALFPPERVWFEIVAGGEVGEQYRDAVNEAAEKHRNEVFERISESNFAEQLDAMMHDVFVGTGAMMVERGPSVENPLEMTALPLDEIYPIAKAGGGFEGCMRSFETPAKSVPELYEAFRRWLKMPPDLATMIREKPQEPVRLLEVNRSLPSGHQRVTVYLQKSKEVILDYTGSDPEEPPRIVLTAWRRLGREAYGRGPADRAMETARFYNHKRDNEAKADDRRVDPPWLIDVDSQLQPSTFRPVPRAVIPYSSALIGHTEPAKQLTDRGNVNLEQMKFEDLKASLDEMLFASKTLPSVADSHQMTAAEIRVRWLQKLREEGADFGGLNRGFGSGFIRRVVWVLQSFEIVSQALKVNGRLFKIRYAGPLSTAKDADDATNLESGIQGAIATVGPEMVADRLRLEDVPAELVRLRNMPSKLIRPEDEANQRAEARMQAQAAQVAAENGLLQPQQGQ